MKRNVILYPWNVHVSGKYERSLWKYWVPKETIELDVQVMARNRTEAKQMAIEEAKKQNHIFTYAQIKIKRKDIVRA